MTGHRRAGIQFGRRRAWMPSLLGGRYAIGHELGGGAAAVTVAAQDQRLGRRVAIKILKPAAEPETDPEFGRRFTREARAAASVNHRNVVSIYDVGEEDGLLYLVMQLVDGTDLSRLLQREGALPWQRAVAIARDVLAGLEPIHAAGIVHRDIKPQNVLIGRDGEVRVTDFGVAHVELDTSMTTAGTTLGTAAYMAPEQAQGQAVTPAADVYAVGVMLYEMVSGRLPFSEPTPVATMLAHIQQAAPLPTAPAGMTPLPDGVVLAIRQAMEKEPALRFHSATAMRRALEHPEASGGSENASAGRTEVVPPVARTQRASPARRSGSPPPRQPRTSARAMPEPESGSGGGFAMAIVVVLVILALGLAATAGALWFLDQQDGNDAPANAVAQPTGTSMPPTQTPTTPPNEPGVIGPAGQNMLPPPTTTPTSGPTPTLVPTTAPERTPTPTQVMIVPGGETLPAGNVTEPSTEPAQAPIIEPVEGGAVSPEPAGRTLTQENAA